MIIKVDDNGTIKSAVIAQNTSELDNDSGFMSYNVLECAVSSTSATDEERAESVRTAMLSSETLAFAGMAVFRPGGNYWPVIATFRLSDGAGSIIRPNWGGNQIIKYRYNGSSWSVDSYIPVSKTSDLTNDSGFVTSSYEKFNDIGSNIMLAIAPGDTDEHSYSCAWSNYRAVVFVIGNYNNVSNSVFVPYSVLNATTTGTKISLLFFSNSGAFSNCAVIRKNDASSVYVQFTTSSTTHRVRAYGIP